MKQFDDDIISGSILKSVWKITWPVVITQLVAGVHGFLDHMMVGRYVGYEAQAAIGVSWQLFLVILVFLSSFFHGMNILMARYSGRRDHDAINRVFFEVLKISVYLLLLFVAPVGYFAAPYLLQWVTTDEVMVYALPYLRLLFTGAYPLFIMFLLNGAFQSTGYPKIPLYFGIGTTIFKIIVSFILITGVGPFPEMGVLGAGIGTCIGPLPSVFIAFYLILNHKVIIAPPKSLSFKMDWAVIRSVARIGIPSGIQAVLLNLGGAVLLGYIASLEGLATEALAAYTVCYGQLFSLVTWTGFGLRAACATVMGQNIGAGKLERGKKGVYVGAMVGFIWAALLGILYWAIPGHLLRFISVTDETVIEIGTELLHFLSFSGLFVVVTLAFTGGLQGAGDTKRPMVIAFITQIIVLLGICAFFQQRGELTTTVIWSSILVAHLSRLTLTYAMFVQGKWKHIKVELDHT